MGETSPPSQLSAAAADISGGGCCIVASTIVVKISNGIGCVSLVILVVMRSVVVSLMSMNIPILKYWKPPVCSVVW